MMATGSRLISGHSKMHEVIERELSVFYHHEAVLMFNSEYNANYRSILQYFTKKNREEIESFFMS